MTVRELIRELITWPNDLEVWIEVQGKEAIAQGIDMQTGGASSWITIHDYKEK